MRSSSVHGVRVLPFDQKIVTATSSFAASGTLPDARAVVIPVVQPSWNHPDDDPLLELQGVWRFSIVYVNIQKKTIVYLGPAQHDQGCVRAIQVRQRTYVAHVRYVHSRCLAASLLLRLRSAAMRSR